MSNPLFALFNQGMQGNNPMEMINRFMQFKNNFKGNPQEEVQKIINSGKFTQEQINQAQNMARQFQTIINGIK